MSLFVVPFQLDSNVLFDFEAGVLSSDVFNQVVSVGLVGVLDGKVIYHQCEGYVAGRVNE